MNELIEFSLDTENAEKNYQLARFYEEQGHTAPAHSYYLRGAERTENKDLAYQALIRASFCYKEQGSRDLTEKNLLENALMLLPERPEAYYFLSLIYEKKQEWQNCYIYANLGLQYSDKKSIVPEYQGKHLLIFTKAVSAWWWGKGDESRNLFDFIYQYHWENFDELHKNCIKENLIKVGKPIVEQSQLFNYPDNFDWADLTEEDIVTIDREIIHEKVYRFWNDVKENDVVLDVGASVGAYTISILDQKPKKVYCVEPSKNLLKTLVKNCSEKLFSNPNTSITYINNGIVNNNNDKINVFGSDKNFIPITFKQLIEKYFITKIDYMKVDCEGGEYSIFTEENFDFIFNNVKFVSIEIHLKGEGFREKFKYFRDNFLIKFDNYKVMSCTRQNINWGNSLDITSNIFDDEFIDNYNCEFMVYIKNVINSSVKKKKVFIDAGTHLFQGFEKISELQKINNSWECYCFEANPFTFEMSKQKYSKLIENGFNIQHFNNAISNKNEIVNINCAEADSWDDSLIGSSTSQASNILKCPPEYCSEKNIIYTDTKSVITINFSDFISHVCNKNDFVVVKLDIEGSEFDVLDKLIDDNSIDYIDEIYIEFHSHFFKNPMLYEEKIKTYKKLFEQKNIKFIQWY